MDEDTKRDIAAAMKRCYIPPAIKEALEVAVSAIHDLSQDGHLAKMRGDDAARTILNILELNREEE